MSIPAIGDINYLDNWLDDRNSYEWFSLIATLDFGRDSIVLNDFESGSVVPSPQADAFLPAFIHEYTHFLQNMGTLWGVLNLSDLIQSAFLISCGTERKTPKLVSAGWTKIGDVFDRFPLTSSKRIDLGLKVPELCLGMAGPVEASNGNTTVKVDVKCIRENMARCATELFLGKGDEAIHVTGTEYGGFHCQQSGVLWSRQPEYWILFEHFYLWGFHNVAKGVYRMCAYLLNYPCPASAFRRFASWLNYTEPGDLWGLTETWYYTDLEKARRIDAWRQLTLVINETVRLAAANQNENDAVDILVEFGALAKLVATKLNQDGSLFIEKIDEIASLQFWASRIRSIGSPVLRFHDKSEVWGATANHGQALTNLAGITEILHRRGQDSFSCKFFCIYPICTARKDDHLCGTSPHKWTSEHGCLFVNSMKILGMENGRNWQS